MFGTVAPTPFDLEFVLFRIPVRVSVWFWAAGVFLGYSTLRAGVPFLLTWLLVLFVSILVHELGHALTARLFGFSPRILLYHFGGLASYEEFGRPHSTSRSILITLAGPGAGFVLFGAVWFGMLFLVNPLANNVSLQLLNLIDFAAGQLLFINLYWGLVNLVPVLPLDGGQICREVCQRGNRYQGLWRAVQISVVVAGLMALWFYSQHQTYAAVMFAILCMNNISLLQQRGSW